MEPVFMPPMKSSLPASEPASSIGGSAPLKSIASKAWDKKHAIMTLMLALGFAGDIASRNGAGPVTELQSAPPAESQKKNDEPPSAAPPKAPVPDRYETAIRAAWQIEGGQADLSRKRLIHLYRGSIDKLKVAKAAAEFNAAFAAEEERLEMKGRLPLLRAEVRKEWESRFGIDTIPFTDKHRAEIAELLTQTIAILNKL